MTSRPCATLVLAKARFTSADAGSTRPAATVARSKIRRMRPSSLLSLKHVEDADRAVAAARKAQPDWSRRRRWSAARSAEACDADRREHRDAGALLPPKAASFCRNRASTRISPPFCCATPPRAREGSRARSCLAKAATSRSGFSACPRRRRRHHRLELPRRAVRPQGRPGAGDGQHHRRQAARADAVDHAGARRTQPARRHT